MAVYIGVSIGLMVGVIVGICLMAIFSLDMEIIVKEQEEGGK